MRYLRNAAAHKLVAKVAQEMAAEIFDTLMRRNEWYDLWKQKNPSLLTPSELEAEYIRVVWPTLLEEARATLAKMLEGPYDEATKQEIADALVKDTKLREERVSAARSYRSRAISEQMRALDEAHTKGLLKH